MNVELEVNKFLESDNEKDEEYEKKKHGVNVEISWITTLRFCGKLEDPEPHYPKEFAKYINSLSRESKNYDYYNRLFKNLEKSVENWRKIDE